MLEEQLEADEEESEEWLATLELFEPVGLEPLSLLSMQEKWSAVDEAAWLAKDGLNTPECWERSVLASLLANSDSAAAAAATAWW